MLIQNFKFLTEKFLLNLGIPSFNGAIGMKIVAFSFGASLTLQRQDPFLCCKTKVNALKFLSQLVISKSTNHNTTKRQTK